MCPVSDGEDKVRKFVEKMQKIPIIIGWTHEITDVEIPTLIKDVTELELIKLKYLGLFGLLNKFRKERAAIYE